VRQHKRHAFKTPGAVVKRLEGAMDAQKRGMYQIEQL
jgi:hypothetical protein